MTPSCVDFRIATLARAALLSIALLLAGIAPTPSAFAQRNAAPPTDPRAPFAELRETCKKAAGKPSAGHALLAKQIAEKAIAEFAAFDGHEVDRTGRIVRFGSVEVERATDAAWELSEPKVGQIPWRRVARYWETLQGKPLTERPHGALSTSALMEILSKADEKEVLQHKIPLLILLKVIDRLSFKVTVKKDDLVEVERKLLARVLGKNSANDLEAEFELNELIVKEVLREAVVRTALSDIAWSAAFISATLKRAGVKNNQFAFDSSHTTYISEAMRISLGMTSDRHKDDLYRACDIFDTAPRVGDLLCYHRKKEYAPKPDGEFLFYSIANSFKTNNGLPFSVSHCDVVVDVNRATRKVVSIGGNVNQAVTRRTMNLNDAVQLSTRQGRDCAVLAGNAQSIRAKTESEPIVEGNCNLNNQKWFALLQIM